MLFTSLNFFIFFTVVCLFYFIFPLRVRRYYLVLANLVFYASFDPSFVLVLLFVVLISWGTALFIQRNDLPNRRKVFPIVGCFLIFSPLLVFKYSDFLYLNLSSVLRRVSIQAPQIEFALLLPVGISFFSFKAVSYVLDVYRGKLPAEKSLLHIALYISFFPTLLSGPIDRASGFLPQLKQGTQFDLTRVKHGVCLMLWGLFLKVVLADRIGIFVDRVYGSSIIYNHSGFIGLLAAILYGFQIYCDFSGYSIIAIGSAQVLGFALPVNFRHPFFAKTTGELWRRWHITLMDWFRDYLYIPLGGSRVGKVRHVLNITIVFLISGLWHGADWSFVLWGVILAIYQMIELLLCPLLLRIPEHIDHHKSLGYSATQASWTFLLFCFAFIFFRAESISHALSVIRGFFVYNPEVLFDGTLLNFGLAQIDFQIIIMSLILLFLVSWLQHRNIRLRAKIDEQPIWIRWGLMVGLIFVILVFGVYGPDYESSQFIYFQF